MHADGELKPLKILIESLLGSPLLNLAAANEHVPDIENMNQGDEGTVQIHFTRPPIPEDAKVFDNPHSAQFS